METIFDRGDAMIAIVNDSVQLADLRQPFRIRSGEMS